VWRSDARRAQFDVKKVSLLWLVDHALPPVPAPQPAFKLVIAGTIAKLTGASTRARGHQHQGHRHSLKSKLLEALAMGMPVINANLGVTGIDGAYLPRVTVIGDNDAEGFGAVAQRRRTPSERQ
jgi:hypothetical protein